MSTPTPVYDVLVVGGGHAGYEASLAAARMGASTVMVTMESAAIGRMSCNPSVGGTAKSHIVCELDALGGEIGRNADYTGIQFRTLNLSKGPAVRAHRVQCDKDAFSTRMQAVVSEQDRLEVIEGLVTEILLKHDRVRGVRLEDGAEIRAKTLVMATGTFLAGKIHIGDQAYSGGRVGEKAADALSASFRGLGFRMGQLKTGTPPRLHVDSIDFKKMDRQPGLEPPPFFSRRAEQDWMFHVEHPDRAPAADPLFHVEHPALRPWTPGTDQVPCFLTHTTQETHAIIRDNLHRSALYAGHIGGTGVRYCPSIEDKIVKFPDRTGHHVFIEPEGRSLVDIYPNGTSNSLPEEVQKAMIRSIPGLERAEFIRPGYAIEYDFCDPTQLNHALETEHVEGLFLAGQINGTTGYEEAAGQGFVAGVNAALKAKGSPPFRLSRNESYLGVLIDDLVTLGTDEPYRMFTSRAEYRLVLRQDNACYRMVDHAERLGILPPATISEVRAMQSKVKEEIQRLCTTFEGGRSLAQLVRQPGAGYDSVCGPGPALPAKVREQVEIELKYEGYIKREMNQISKSEKVERQLIPADIDYRALTALRAEAIEKLERVRPESLGQASRISGVNPADIAILSVWLKKMTGVASQQ